MKIMRRINITVDPESLAILEYFKQRGLNSSYVIRKALVKAKSSYVEKDNG